MRHIGGTKMAAHIIARFFKSREVSPAVSLCRCSTCALSHSTLQAMHKLDVLITKFRALMRSVNRTVQQAPAACCTPAARLLVTAHPLASFVPPCPSPLRHNTRRAYFASATALALGWAELRYVPFGAGRAREYLTPSLPSHHTLPSCNPQWRRRYFVLSSKDGALTYHASEVLYTCCGGYTISRQGSHMNCTGGDETTPQERAQGVVHDAGERRGTE